MNFKDAEDEMSFPKSRVPNTEIPISGDCEDRVDPGVLYRKPSTIQMKTLSRHFLDYLLVVAVLALLLLVAASSASVGSWLAVSGN